MKTKEICKLISPKACPKCGRKEFLIYENTEELYLTNRAGEIIDHNGMSYSCKGVCLNCKSTYDMLSVTNGYIPLTKLRKLLYNYPIDDKDHDVKVLDNPMEVK